MKNSIILISGTSGVGKSTLISGVLRNSNISLSVSHTTRQIRKNEVDGKDYFYVIKDTFLKLKDENKFYETTEYDSEYYGTSYDQLNKNAIVIVDVEREGSLKFNEFHVCKIFLYADKHIIYNRLMNRLNDKDKANQRIATYDKDIENLKSGTFDYVINVNNYEHNLLQLEEIIFNFHKQIK